MIRSETSDKSLSMQYILTDSYVLDNADNVTMTPRKPTRRDARLRPRRTAFELPGVLADRNLWRQRLPALRLSALREA